MRSVFVIAFFLVSFQAVTQEKDAVIFFKAIDTTGAIKWDVFKFYVSDLKVQFQDGSLSPKSNSFYLIDMNEPGASSIRLSVENDQQITGIDFSIGTDSITNVSGAFDGPLDPIHGMFWTWNTGYINLKLEGSRRLADQSQEFEYHIGGYAGEFRTLRRVHIDYSESDVSEFKVKIDLNQLMSCFEILGTNQIMSPGANAALLATHFATCFYEAQ